MPSSLQTIQQLNQVFTHFETTPLSPYAHGGMKPLPDGKTFKEWIQEAGSARTDYLERQVSLPEAARIKAHDLVFGLLGSKTYEQEEREEIQQLDRQRISLMYRTHMAQPSPAPVAEFTKMIADRKKDKSLFPGGDGKLTESDKAKIDEVCTKYPLFAKALLKDKQWTGDFIKFCLRSGIAVDVFVLLPNESKWMMDHHLDKRYGAIDPSMVQIQKRDGVMVLSLKMNGVFQRVQGDFKHEPANLDCDFKGKHYTYDWTIAQVCDQIQAKTHSYEHVEVTHKGIIAFNAIELGVYNQKTGKVDRVNPKDKDWLSQLPTLKSVTLKELQDRYPDQKINLKKGESGFIVRVNRAKADLNLIHNHAFAEFVIPDPAHPGKYLLYPMGFQPTSLPDNKWDMLKMFQHSLPAGLHYPDEGIYLLQRQHAGLFFTLRPDEYPLLMRELSKFLTKVQEGKKCFQSFDRNCARFVQRLFNKVLGQRFFQPLSHIAKTVLPEKKVHILMKRIVQDQDNQALEELLDSVLSNLCQGNHVGRLNKLMDVCLDSLALTMRTTKQELLGKLGPIDLAEVLKQMNGAALAQKNGKKLAMLAHLNQQFFRVNVHYTTILVPGLKQVFNGISSLPTVFLRNIATRALLIFIHICVFFRYFSWGGYIREKDINGSKVKVHVQVRYSKLFSTLNLPAALLSVWKPQQESRKLHAQKLLCSFQPGPFKVGA